MASIKYKDPDAVLDWEIDWSNKLETGETISASTWTVPAGITKDSDSFTGTATTVWLSGGTLGEGYTVVNHITTNLGRERDKTIIFIIRED